MADEPEVLETGQPAPVAEPPVEQETPAAPEPVGASEDAAPEPAPEAPKKTAPEIGDTRWNRIYWENKQLGRELEALKEKLAQHEERVDNSERTSRERTQAELEAAMDKAAESNDTVELNRLFKERLKILAAPSASVPQPRQTTRPQTRGDEFRQNFTSMPENLHLVVPESQGGNLETGVKVFETLMTDPAWSAAYDNVPELFWGEMTRRVSEAKAKPVASASPVEAVKPGGPRPKSSKMTIEQVSEETKAPVSELVEYAKKMYTNSADPVQEYINNYVKYARGV